LSTFQKVLPFLGWSGHFAG